MSDINDIDQGLVTKILNLLAVANDKRGNENEAANAMRAAQRLADAHNLSLANLDPEARNKSASKRTDTKLGGGLYVWQRELYAAIAKLNHCVHWCAEEDEEGKVSAYAARKYGAQYARDNKMWGKTWRHRLLGSPVNVLATQMMADYLQSTIERLARDYVDNNPKMYFIQDAIAFREGASARIIGTINTQREADIAEQRRQKEAAQARGDGMSLMIMDDIADIEHAANYDHQHGEGAWARILAGRAAEEAARQKRIAAAEEAARIQKAYDEAHPEEAAARKAKEQADWEAFVKSLGKGSSRSRSRSYSSTPRERQQTDREARRSSGAYYDGSAAGSKVSLNKQVDESKKGLLK